MKTLIKKFAFGLYALSLVLAYIIFLNTMYFITVFSNSGGKTYISSDQQTAIALSAPLAAYYKKTGILPQWSPYVFCGMPSTGSTMYAPDMYIPYHFIAIFLVNPIGMVMLSMLIVYGFKWKTLDESPSGKRTLREWLVANCMRVWFIAVSAGFCLFIALLFKEPPLRFIFRSLIWFAAVGWLTLFMSDIKGWSIRKQLIVASSMIIWIFYI